MKKVLNGISILISVLISLVLFVLIILLGADIAAKRFLKTTTFSEAVREMEFQVIFLDEENKETETGKRIYDYFDDMGITRDEVNKIIKNDKFKKLFGDYFGSILLKKINAETEIIYPTKEELYDFVNTNYEFFKKVLKVKETDKEGIRKIIYKEYDYVSLELKTIANELTKEKVESKYLDILLKPILTWALIGGIVVCIILLMLLRRSLHKWLMWFYMPAMTAALTLGFLSLLANKIIVSFLTKNIREYGSLIEPFVGSLSNSLLLYAAVIFVLSIVCYIIHYLCKNKNTEENKKEK